jgi:GNAT superfamily N-acetyltransferase
VELAELPIGKSDQLGAVRWYPATGEVDQIYVHPDFRRRRLGSGLVAAAAALSYARGWPRLWSDGQRTELGERFRNASPWRQRTAQLTHVVRPMTPGEA